MESVGLVGVFSQGRLVGPGGPLEVAPPMLLQGLAQVDRHGLASPGGPHVSVREPECGRGCAKDVVGAEPFGIRLEADEDAMVHDVTSQAFDVVRGHKIAAGEQGVASRSS